MQCNCKLIGVKHKEVKATSLQVGWIIILDVMWGGSWNKFELEVMKVRGWKEDGVLVVSVELKNKDGHTMTREWWNDQKVVKVTRMYKQGDCQHG